MVTVFTVGKNSFEVKYERIDRPTRIRASNAVRHWEILQLEENTHHLFEDFIHELGEIFHLKFSPDGVKEMSESLYDEPNGQKVQVGLHHTHHKLRNLTLSQTLLRTSHLMVHSLLVELDIVSFDAVKVVVSIYVTNNL